MTRASVSIAGRRILVVEDDYFVAQEMVRAFAEQGAEIVGPVATVDDAIDIVEDGQRLDAAVLDLNLQGEMVFPVADALRERGVPFVLATGYDRWAVPSDYADVKLCEKPVDAEAIAAALFG